MNVLDCECRPLRLLKVETLAMIRELVGVNPDKVDLALVRRSDRFEALDEVFSVLVISWDEEVSQRHVSLCIRGKVVGSDFVEQRCGMLLNKGGQFIRCDGALVIVAPFVELLVQNHGGCLHACR